MLCRPKVLYIVVISFHRLLSPMRGLWELFYDCNFADYVKVPQI